MPKQYTNEELASMRLVSYERTKADALEEAKEHEAATGQRCIVVNPMGIRARRSTYDKPWQVRETGETT